MGHELEAKCRKKTLVMWAKKNSVAYFIKLRAESLAVSRHNYCLWNNLKSRHLKVFNNDILVSLSECTIYILEFQNKISSLGHSEVLDFCPF